MRNFVLALSLTTLVTGTSLTPADALPRAAFKQTSGAEIVQISDRTRAHHRRAARQILRAHRNKFTTEQHGYGNAAGASQHGSANYGAIGQFGNDNYAATQQDGNLNSAITYQTGNGQSAHVNQSGTGNVTIIFQYSR